MKYLEALAISILAVFAPVKAVMLATLGLVFFDFITGIGAAKKRKEPITSTGFKRTIGKIFVYEIALAMGFLCEQYFTGNSIPVCKLISALIGLTEISSVLENLDTINGSGLFKSIIDKVAQNQEHK